MTSRIADFLTLGRSRSAVPGTSKKRVLEYLSQCLSEGGDLPDADTIYRSLLAREELGSTGIGHGVAIPHCRVPGLDRLVGALLHLDRGIDFDAADGEPVDLVFGLIVPEEHRQEHLDALAAIARLLERPENRRRLRAAYSDRDLFEAALAAERERETAG